MTSDQEMAGVQNPYEELPYVSVPIEWTAPEKLVLTSMLHGGPRPDLDAFRVLEIGCGNGANLLPMAFYRPAGHFTGIDSASGAIAAAKKSAAEIGLDNIDFVAVDILDADEHLDHPYDFIIAHGVFSWIPENVRDALLALCQERLNDGGLLYLNYNALPGWNIRGMVRDFLLGQTAGSDDRRARSIAAKKVAVKMSAAFESIDHPYSRLMGGEFRLVAESHESHIAHDHLAGDNHAYWRSQFLSILHTYGFEFVADADFNYPSASIPEDLAATLRKEDLLGHAVEDTVDLLCYRQMQSPILARAPIERSPPQCDEFAGLDIASQLGPTDTAGTRGPIFEHPSGYTVEVEEAELESALRDLSQNYPKALPVGSLLSEISEMMEDLILLYRKGLIELRIPGVALDTNPSRLHRVERAGGYVTTSNHVRKTP